MAIKSWHAGAAKEHILHSACDMELWTVSWRPRKVDVSSGMDGDLLQNHSFLTHAPADTH